MKKAALFLSVFFCVAVAAVAQDTLEYTDIPQGNMVDSTWAEIKTHYRFCPCRGGSEYAKRFVVDDSVTIYGIAASILDMMPIFGNSHHFAYDTTYTNSIEYLRLYYSQADTLVCLAQTPVHLRTTPIAYYLHRNGSPLNHPHEINTPVYERYFDAPVTVYDSFYAGMTFMIDNPYVAPDGSNWQYACPPFALVYLETSETPFRYIIRYHHSNDDGSSYDVWGHGMNNSWGYMLLFPLLLPPDTSALGNDTTLVSNDTMIVSDTVIVGGDTVIVNDTVYIGDVNVGSDTVARGDTLVATDTLVIDGDTIVVTDTILSIMPPDLLQRLTGVTPNPARGTARVVASTGLTRVEVYSLAGRKIHTQRVPQGALSVTLDVSRWPAGTYLLRIHTPMGATIKKLTVAR